MVEAFVGQETAASHRHLKARFYSNAPSEQNISVMLKAKGGFDLPVFDTYPLHRP